MALCDVENQHTCVKCYTGQGPCDGLKEFLNELTLLSYKHGLVLCVTQDSDGWVAVVPMSDEDKLLLRPEYTEVKEGSGLIQF